MAKKLSTVKKTKNGLVLDVLKISDLDPNIIQGYIHLNDKGGKRFGRWRYDKKNNVGIYTLDLKNHEKVGELDLDLTGIKVNDENDLFTFSASGGPARFFYWLYQVKPNEAFKGMCPYFWSYVLTFLFIWIILPVVLLFKLIKATLPKLIDNIEERSNTYRRNKELKFLEKWSKEYKTLTPEKAYRLTKTKCYRKWGYYLEEEARYFINDISYKEEMYIRDTKWREETIKEEKINKIKVKSKEYKENIKESIIVKIIGFIISAFILYLIVMLLYSVSYVIPLTYNFIIESLPVIGEGLIFLAKLIVVAILLSIVLYGCFLGLKKLICWLSCNIKINLSCPKWLYKLGNAIEVGCKYIIKFFDILITTIIAIYENNCPRITWKK